MDLHEQSTACRKAISEWNDLTQLTEFAMRRHGYCNSNNATGVTYPGDVDEYQVEVEVVSVPAGWVQVFVFQDPLLSEMGYEMLVPEHVYLSALADALKEANCWIKAYKMRRLAIQTESKYQSDTVSSAK